MRKKLLPLALSIAMILSITGCGNGSNQQQNSTESTKATTESTNESKNIDIDIDWNKCIDDLKNDLELEPDYAFVQDYDIQFKDNQITITATVDDSTDPEKALDFADTLVRQLNLFAQMQDDSIKSSNQNFYGGIYDSYNAMVGIAPISCTKDTSKWFVYSAITSGKGPKMTLAKEYQ